jgi:NAD(P)H-hydrate epimerase
LVEVIESAGKPLLLDADGLKAFAEFKRKLRVPLVLTPHAGEYAILTGKKLPEDFKERVSEVQKTAVELGATILLKGPVDIISNEKYFKLNFTGNPGMTVGGTGDVLSGIAGTFLAQGINPFEAAVAGAFVNGAAGDFVFEEKGYHMVATDLISWIPRVLNDPMSHAQVRKAHGKKG